MALVYLDSCIFVAAFEINRDEHLPLRGLIRAFQRRGDVAATSELTLAELLSPIKRPGAASLEERRDLYLDLFDEGRFIKLLPVSRSILIDTASIRSEHSQRLPDAIHVATAVAARCRFFMSFDRDARRLPTSLTWVTPAPDDIAAVLAALDA